MEKGGRLLVDIVIEDVDKSWLDGLPGGWTKNSNFYYDGFKKHTYNEEGEITDYAFDVVEPVDEADYTSHIAPPVDSEGVPTGDPAVYHRLHKIFGHPSY